MALSAWQILVTAILLRSSLQSSLATSILDNASSQPVQATVSEFDTAFSVRIEDRLLDIVIAHYDNRTIEEVTQLWSSVLQMPAVSALTPSMFLYCQGQESSDTDLQWFSDHGKVVRLENVGRESHVFMWHIVHNYGSLARHTLFHQDVNDPTAGDIMLSRLHLLEPQTGMLALSHISLCHCEVCYLTSIPKVKEIWAMARRSFCGPDDTYATFLKGAFLVSSQRVMNLPKEVYVNLLEYLEAPAGHWIHAEHHHEWGKIPSNSLSAHVIERSWNILFDCLQLDGPELCTTCPPSPEVCRPSGCQCLDAAG